MALGYPEGKSHDFTGFQQFFHRGLAMADARPGECAKLAMIIKKD
jgi:hypothetical protein